MKKIRIVISIALIILLFTSSVFAIPNSKKMTTKVVKNTATFTSVVKNIKDNMIITGSDSEITIVDLEGSSLKLDGLQNVEFRNIHFINAKYIKISNSKDITIVNSSFNDFVKSGLYLYDSSNVRVSDSEFSNIGSEDIEVSWQGAAIYASNIDVLTVSNNEISHTFGHGSVFVNNSKNLLIENNHIHDTFFRGIQLYDGTLTGTIKDNTISDIGSINTSHSGVGVNGIFAAADDLYGVDVLNNTITNVLENGIEGRFGRVENNIIDGTGIDVENHPTPSTEGIYANGLMYKNNIVKNTHGDGIKVYSPSLIDNLTIIDNLIIHDISGASGISLIGMNGYENVLIEDNEISGYTRIIHIHNDFTNSVVTNNNILFY